MAKSIDKLKFQDLMQYRVHEILLVASPYDAFILEQDGRLSEQILSKPFEQFRDLATILAKVVFPTPIFPDITI